jgi:hypothetical protein
VHTLADARLDVPQGALELLMLRTLAVGPQHGWAISQRVQQTSSDVLRIQQGSLYPHFTGPHFTGPNGAPGLKPHGAHRRTNAARSTTSSPAAEGGSLMLRQRVGDV